MWRGDEDHDWQASIVITGSPFSGKTWLLGLNHAEPMPFQLLFPSFPNGFSPFTFEFPSVFDAFRRLVHRFCTQRLPAALDQGPFLGSGNLRVAQVALQGQRLTRGRLRLWEPSGMSRQQVLPGYLRSAQAVVLCFDVAVDSEKELRKALRDVREAPFASRGSWESAGCAPRHRGGPLRPPSRHWAIRGAFKPFT